MQEHQIECNDSFESSTSMNEANAPTEVKNAFLSEPTSINQMTLNTEIENENENEQSKEDKLFKKKKEPKIIMCVANTKYAVVKHVGKKIFKFKLTKDENEYWDLCWQDGGVSHEFLINMKPYQKVNHFPGMESISRKNNLGKNLMNMRKTFPLEYRFFPKTWVLPIDYSDLRTYDEKNKNNIYIVKPEASCQGRGIYLVRRVDEIKQKDHHIVQKYLSNPLLIDNLKFDMRIYVLVFGCNPMRIYLYKEGLARFCTEEYERPNIDNLYNTYMHLTNYAINKNSEKFIFNENANQNTLGHKRSLTSVFALLQKMKKNTDKIKADIEDAIIKTLLSIQPSLAHLYNSCQTNDFDGGCCFEILGFDFILNSKLKPLLLEVNHAPSFTTDTPFDWEIKKDLIKDTIKLLHLTRRQRVNFLNVQKHEIMKRMLLNKTVKFSIQSKLKKKEKRIQKRVEYESKHLGDFKLIYPNENQSIYDVFLNEAIRRFNVFTNGNKNPKIKEEKNIPEITKIPETYREPPIKAKSELVKKKVPPVRLSQLLINNNNFNFNNPIISNIPNVPNKKHMTAKNQTQNNSQSQSQSQSQMQMQMQKSLLTQVSCNSIPYTPNIPNKLEENKTEIPKTQKELTTRLNIPNIELNHHIKFERKFSNFTKEGHVKPFGTFQPLKVVALKQSQINPEIHYEKFRPNKTKHRNIPRCTSAKSDVLTNQNSTIEKKKASFL